MPRKTDANNPADWLWIAEAELDMVRLTAEKQISYSACRGKLAEVLEKILKAELIRIGWPLERTHDLERLLDELVLRKSDLEQMVLPLCDGLADAYFSDRYPGFDLEDPNWVVLNQQLQAVSKLLATIRARLSATPPKP